MSEKNEPELDLNNENEQLPGPSLFIPNPDYHRLEDVLYGTEGFIRKAKFLTEVSLRTKKEDGGMVVVDKNGVVDVVQGGRPGELFGLNWREIPTEEFLEFKLTHQGKPLADMVFVDQELAERNPQYFAEAIEAGVPVIMNKQPVGPIHIHYSGNLPSPGDFIHAFDSTISGRKMPEFVGTNGWVYSLLPTKQTPELTIPEGNDLSGELNDQAKRMTTEFSARNNPDPLNAARLKLLQENCPKYSIGLYALKTNQLAARRIA